MKKLTIEEIKDCCYKDLEGNAYSILSLLLANQNSKHVGEFFSLISENELKERHFTNIDWKAIANIANNCVSRQETLKYLNNVLGKFS